MNKRVILILAIAIGFVVTVAALYFASAAPPQAVVVRMVTSNPPAQNDMVVSHFEQRHWNPDLIHLKLGVPNTIVIASNDDIETHQFAIPDLNVTSPPVKPFDSVTLTITPMKTGTFKFIDPRPAENYTWTDYREQQIHQMVDHSEEIGVVEVTP